MFSIEETDGALRTLRLRDDSAGSEVEVAPARGGMVAGFAVRGRSILFLDPVSFLDTSTNVRGGVPILFPSPGKLSGDAWSRGGASGILRQHGFARQLPWEAVSRATDGAARLTLRLASSAETLASWPWRFTLDVAYALAGAKLRLDVRVLNEGATAMPFGFGVHPYFAVADADKPKLDVPTKATRAFDNVAKREVPFTGFAFAAGEVDLHLLDHGSNEASLGFPDGARVVVRGSSELGHWVVWSLKGRDFVCLEPWSCPGDALNTGKRLLEAAPGQERNLWLEIELTGA
ncbi:MAG TPA: galactose mutarotase [Byssovorax sp.]|jgi:galactose mutarotase-like enzyme